MFYEIKMPRILTPRDFSNTEIFQTMVCDSFSYKVYGIYTCIDIFSSSLLEKPHCIEALLINKGANNSLCLSSLGKSTDGSLSFFRIVNANFFFGIKSSCFVVSTVCN